eukprot:SAG11_NODE_1920_length_4069_cov_3.001511_3_plen_78_part_00
MAEIDISGALAVIPKVDFSMVTDEVNAVLETIPDRRDIVLFGLATSYSPLYLIESDALAACAQVSKGTFACFRPAKT